jgi:DUF4097 and DUF4098 domain-containing protein YvlB
MSQQSQNTLVPVNKSEFVEETNKTFEVTELAALVVAVSNISGAVMVEAWEQATVQIRAVKRARSQRSFDRTQVEITQDGAEIRARTRIDEETIIAGVMDLLRGDRAGATVDYSIRMPAAGALRAKNINGPISISGLSKHSEANAVNGPVSLNNLAGQTGAGTVNGSLKAAELSGTAELSTVNGSLHLAGGELKRLAARTVSGSIHAALTIAPGGDYDFSTTNGNCELTLPADSRCTITMQAVNGGVECALPHKTVSSEMRPAFSRWEGAVNGGGAPVSVRTVNGRLRVTAGAAAEKPAGSPPASSTSGGAVVDEAASSTEPAERGMMDILRAVERGELSVDDAMKAMGTRRAREMEAQNEHAGS